MVRDIMRIFVEAEIVPHVDALESGEMTPYPIIQKMYKTFGMDEMAKAKFEKLLAREEGSGDYPCYRVF